MQPKPTIFMVLNLSFCTETPCTSAVIEIVHHMTYKQWLCLNIPNLFLNKDTVKALGNNFVKWFVK